MDNSSYIKNILKCFLFVNAFNLATIFRVREYGSDTIDFQIFIKLIIWGVTFGFCLLYAKLWLKKMFLLDNIFLFILLCLFGISCFYAPNLSYSVGCVFSLFAIFPLVFLSSCLLGNRDILKTILSSFTLVSILSLIFYFVYPEFGRMSEWEDGVKVIGNRLAGVTGTGNTMGSLAAFALFIAFYLKKYEKSQKSLSLYIYSSINFMALAMSGSKTAIVGLVLSIFVGHFSKMSSARLAFMFLSLALMLIFSSMLDFDLIFSMLSRSGDADEITSGTGRVFIWPIVIDLINQKPFFGWGYASSVRVLPLFSDVIGHTPSHTHSLYLQILFSVGYLGFFLFILLCMVKIYNAFRFGDDCKIAGLFLILFSGFSEAYVFVGVANQATLVFAIILALEYRNNNTLHLHKTWKSPLKNLNRFKTVNNF